MRFDILLLASTVSAAAANWPGESSGASTVTVTVCETAPAPVVPTHTPSVPPAPVVPTPTKPAKPTSAPAHTPTVPAIPAPTAGAIPNHMKASMAGLMGFLIVGLAAL